MDNFAAALSVSLLRNAAHLFKTPGLFSNSQHSSTFFLFTVKLSFAYRFEHVNFHFTLSGLVCMQNGFQLRHKRWINLKNQRFFVIYDLLGFFDVRTSQNRGTSKSYVLEFLWNSFGFSISVDPKIKNQKSVIFQTMKKWENVENSATSKK